MAISASVLICMAAAASTATASPRYQVSKVSIAGDGGHDYITVEPGSGRVFLSRSTPLNMARCSAGLIALRSAK